MDEIEVKIPEVDPEALIEKLKGCGAAKGFEGEIHAIYFDTNDGMITKQGKVLRVRREGNRTALTYKEKIYGGDAGVKAMRETETECAGFDEMYSVFLALGYKVILEMKKFRRQFDLPDAHVVIDTYLGNHSFIPPFAEIEAGNAETVYRIAALLGYSPADCKPWNSADLIAHYKGSG